METEYLIEMIENLRKEQKNKNEEIDKLKYKMNELENENIKLKKKLVIEEDIYKLIEEGKKIWTNIMS